MTTLRGPMEPSQSTIATLGATTLAWRYETLNPRIRSLYDRAVAGQWTVDDIDWSPDVPRGEVPAGTALGIDPAKMAPHAAFPLPAECIPAFSWEFHVWLVSQFMHGEQGALACAARLVEVLPTVETKLLAASQAMDEARHVDVFVRYTHQKLGTVYAVDPNLEELLRQIVADGRWDIVCLGMQIIIEGLALAGLRLAAQRAPDPIIASITERVARDEARHVSFGMMALGGYYDALSAAERADREDFILEAARLMASRFDLAEVWERFDIPAAEGRAFVTADPSMRAFRQILFSRVTASVARLGLLSDRVRNGLVQMGLYRPVIGGTWTDG